MADSYRLKGGLTAGGARKDARSAYFAELSRYTECAVHDRYALRAGDEVEGPALVEERESTCVIGPGDRVHVDDRLNLIADLAPGGDVA